MEEREIPVFQVEHQWGVGVMAFQLHQYSY